MKRDLRWRDHPGNGSNAEARASSPVRPPRGPPLGAFDKPAASTTLGYGDLGGAGPLVGLLAGVEALLGPALLVVVVARRGMR